MLDCIVLNCLIQQVILGATSDYFQALFSSEMIESRQDRVKLQGLTAAGLEPLIEFIYTGKLDLNLNTVENILGAASHLQILPAVKMCEEFMSEVSVDIANCVDLLCIAEMYSVQDAVRRIQTFIEKHFFDVVRTNRFHNMTSEQLERILEGGHIRHGSEFQLFQCVHCWIHNNVGDRAQHSKHLFKHVAFHQMASTELSIIQQIADEHNDATLSKLVNEAEEYHRLAAEENIDIGQMYQGKKFRNTPSIVAISETPNAMFTLDLCDNVENDELSEMSSANTSIWRQRRGLLHNYSHSSAAVQNNILYVCGGCQPKSYHTKDECFMFDPRCSTWCPIAPMLSPRAYFPIVVYEDTLLVLGGACYSSSVSDGELTDDIERYSTQNNTWTKVGVLPEKVLCHAACVLGSLVYITGGIDEDEHYSNKMTIFDPQSLIGEVGPSMHESHADHNMVAIQERIYILDANESNVECFNPKSMQWTVITGMEDMPKIHTAIAFEGEVYAFPPKCDEENEVEDMRVFCGGLIINYDCKYPGAECPYKLCSVLSFPPEPIKQFELLSIYKQE